MDGLPRADESAFYNNLVSTARNTVNRKYSCGTRTIKPGERNLYIELQKHKLDQIMQEKREFLWTNV